MKGFNLNTLTDIGFTIGDTHITAFHILKALILVTIALWVVKLLSNHFKKAVGKMKSARANTQILLVKLFNIVAYLIVAFITLNALGIKLTTLAVLGGAIGVGIGFGLQKIAANFISGIILIFERSIKVGDILEVNGGTMGKVKHITARYTLLEDYNGRELMLPNEKFITDTVINYTHTNKRSRININVGVAYGNDLNKAYETLLNAAKSHSKCLEDPAPTCILTEYADSSINFCLHFWINDITDGSALAKHEVMMEIWRAFKANGIEMPFPQMDIHLIKTTEKNA